MFIFKKIYNLKRSFVRKFYKKYFKYLFSDLGKNSVINGKIEIRFPENIHIGKHSVINFGCLLNARDKIEIGDYVHISPYTVINTGGLDYNKKMAERKHISQPVNINDGVWVGSGAIINPGIKIGKNSVIAAGSVVTKNVPENVVVAGVPAKIMKKI